jgi:hypothetical protein
MTKSARIAELIRLAWLAHGGSLCVGSDNPDVGEILHHTAEHVMEVPLDPATSPPYAARLRMARQLFASAAMSEASGLGMDAGLWAERKYSLPSIPF